MNQKKYTKSNILSFEAFLSPRTFLKSATVTSLVALVYDLLENAESWQETIGKVFTVADLKSRIVYAHSTNKSYLVESYYQNYLSMVSMVGSVSYGFGSGQTWQSTVDKKLRERQESDWQKHLEEMQSKIAEDEKKEAARLAAMENPETLEAFIDLYRVKGFEGMTDGQASEFDRLLSERDQTKRQRRLEEKAGRLNIELDDVVFEIVDTVHSQKGYDLFVVRFSEWLPRKQWLEAYERCKEFGGWYSNFDKDGAITGLQFKSEESRRLFCESVLTGGQQLAEHIKEAKRLQAMSASDRFIAMAERLEAREIDNLEYKGLTNTARRAGIAARVEENARKAIALAGTMRNLAKYIKDKPESILSGIRYRTQLLELLTLLKHNPEVRAVKYPVCAISKDLAWDLKKAASNHGAVMAASMINKRLKDAQKEACKIARKKDEERTFAEISDSMKIVINSRIAELLGNKGVEGSGMWFIGNKYTTISRLERMGLNMAYELRTALRELSALVVEPGEGSAFVQMERDLQGRKIPGFFPTPDNLIDYMAECAGIDESSVVFEPSAGKGDILARIQGDVKEVSGIEINSDLIKICQAKKLDVASGNFMDLCKLHDGVTSILMNPPFENRQAEGHFMHAHNLLSKCDNPESIVCIAPANLSTAFRGYLADIGAHVEELPDGSFSKAFNATNVRTCLIVKRF